MINLVKRLNMALSEEKFTTREELGASFAEEIEELTANFEKNMDKFDNASIGSSSYKYQISLQSPSDDDIKKIKQIFKVHSNRLASHYGIERADSESKSDRFAEEGTDHVYFFADDENETVQVHIGLGNNADGFSTSGNVKLKGINKQEPSKLPK